MERSGDTIYFDESEQQAGPPFPEFIHVSGAAEVFEQICQSKDACADRLKDMAITEAYDDQTSMLLANAKARRTRRLNTLQSMAPRLVELAVAEIIEDTLAASQ